METKLILIAICAVCWKKVMNTHIKLCYGLSCKYSHLNCSGLGKSDYLHNSCANYTCVSCSVENFPFNYIEDCFEFNNVLHNVFNDFPLFRHFVPNTQQSSILCNQSLLYNDEADPDSNFFGQLHTFCNYSLPSDVQMLLWSWNWKINFSFYMLTREVL